MSGLSAFGHRLSARRGIAMLDVILGGVVLSIGLAVVLSLSSRSLAMQTHGEKQLVASWLADELLTMVLVESPIEYSQTYDTHGWFDEPFSGYQFDVVIEDQGVGLPFLVTAIVRWPHGNDFREVRVESFIALREGDPVIREPIEPIDRIQRWYGEEEEE